MRYQIAQINCDSVCLPPIPVHLVNNIYGEGDDLLIRDRLITWLSKAARFFPKTDSMQELQKSALKHHYKLIEQLENAEYPVFSITYVEIDSDEQ